MTNQRSKQEEKQTRAREKEKEKRESTLDCRLMTSESGSTGHETDRRRAFFMASSWAVLSDTGRAESIIDISLAN